MSEKRELTCIGCPVGCMLEVTLENGVVIDVKGNTCLIGKNYAEKECTNPTRIVTSSVKVRNGEINAVSVKTESDIPKSKIMQCIEELKGIIVEAPVDIGDIIVANVAETGVNVIATKGIAKLN
ncbi:DUF1667 domain-containing protein [Clostridium sp. HMP27]|uniref:DUF1667 domain-containing protein n=1 Tax=Clostridium sp. HMP27 TaxID=1487921 RepID=UPI00052CEC98|nr:DUF1667 domain-containing protein [Clostridium sp. HMP27]KGK89348.1 NAD(FAD)-dependent dehydrogenase [Clostridium sp. HMP27]